jgi:hypothetical protein
MNDADVEFEISMLQGERCGATCALERKARDAFLWSLSRREAGFPEVEGLVNKSHTIGVDIALGANFTDDTDFGFAIGFERAENQFLFGNEFVTRQDAGAMETDDDGFGLFGEHPALGIAADEQDGNRNSDASAATDLLVRHLGNLGKGPRVHAPTILTENKLTVREM